MTKTAVQSVPCCHAALGSLPEYKAKGRFVTYAGIKCYETGPSTATSAILYIYDIFGIYPQTLKGADLLAKQPHPPCQSGNTISSPQGHHSSTGIRVIMPDFFGDNAADIDQYPMNTPAKEKYIMGFFAKQADIERWADVVPDIMEAVDGESEVLRWGVVGFCWGGKMTSRLSTFSTPFVAAAQCHPSLLNREDAEYITIPTMILASMDEDQEEVRSFRSVLYDNRIENFVETFGDQVHGWMTSKANLEDEKARAGYDRGYQMLNEFFEKFL